MQVAILFHDGCHVSSDTIDSAVQRLIDKGATKILLFDSFAQQNRCTEQTGKRWHISVEDVADLRQAFSFCRRLWGRVVEVSDMSLLFKTANSFLLFDDKTDAYHKLLEKVVLERKKIFIIPAGG